LLVIVFIDILLLHQGGRFI